VSALAGKLVPRVGETARLMVGALKVALRVVRVSASGKTAWLTTVEPPPLPFWGSELEDHAVVTRFSAPEGRPCRRGGAGFWFPVSGRLGLIHFDREFP
jgi:hypothetical protein